MSNHKETKTKDIILLYVIVLFFMLFVFGCIYWIRSTDLAHYEKILNEGLKATATITDKYDIPYRHGTSYMFDITYTANKSAYEMDTIKVTDDFSVSWLSSSFDFEFIHTKISVHERIYNQCDIADGIEIMYLLSDPENDIILHPENKQLYAKNK